jgi:signal transduction histidine kinase
MQKELAQLNRLTGLGRLSAQVAHEFNNVLMGLQTSLDVVRRRVTHDEQLSRLVATMTRALGRGRCLTHDMLRFLAPAQVAYGRINVRELLLRSQDEIQHLLGSIELVLRLPAESLEIDGDAQQLSQVFMNLALNARDAMRARGGTLTIAVDGPDAERFIRFTASDTGEGIDPQDMQHIFEPLFTTKASGTGLGLSVVRQIISAHGGHIFATSEKGRGTSFLIYLPAVRQ